MFRIKAVNAFGLLVVVLMGLVAPAEVKASTEPAHQCYQMSPYIDTLRIMRIASDYTPGMVGLFVRWRASTTQFLGTGVRTGDAATAGLKDIVFTAVRTDNGDVWRFSAVWNPATTSGTWTIYGAGTSTASGTLTSIACTTQLAGGLVGEEQPVHGGLSATEQ